MVGVASLGSPPFSYGRSILDYLFTMGFNCRSLISGFLTLAVSCFADFTSNDSATLGAILDCVDTIKDSEAASDSQILYSLDGLENGLGALELEVRTDLPIIKNYVSSIESGVSSAVNTLGYIYTAITDLNNSIQSIDSKISTSDGAIKVYDVGNSVVSGSLHEIAVSLTNLLQNAPLAYEPAFLTNWYASSLPFFYPQLNDKSMGNIYKILFGHAPSVDERLNFSQFYQWSSMASGLQDYLSSISSDDLSQSSLYSSFESSYRIILLAMGLSSSAANTQIVNVKNMARERYYQYGTRPLIQFFESATNDYPLASRSVITPVQTSEGPRPGFSSGFVDTVTSLASSFQINTNLATVSTNEIVDIENSHISGTWEQVRNETPDNYALSDLSNTIQSSLAADSSTVLNIFNESGTQSLDFQFPVSIGPSDYQLNYSIPSTASLYRPYVAFFAAIVKGIIVMYFGLQIWEGVVKEVWMGRRF